MKKRIISILTAVIIIFVLCVPCFAVKQETLYNIYDNNNNIVGYYTVHLIGGSSTVYDIDNVYIFNSNVIGQALNIMRLSFIDYGTYNGAIEDVENYIFNNITIENNQYIEPLQAVRSWFIGFVGGVFSSYFETNYDTLHNYNSQLQTYYNNGYNAGYSSGLTVANNEEYQRGYSVGDSEGYTRGYQEGANTSNERAYLKGYNDGVENSNGASNFVYSLATAPFVFLGNALSFEIFGINIYTIVLFILTVMIIGFVIKILI